MLRLALEKKNHSFNMTIFRAILIHGHVFNLHIYSLFTVVRKDSHITDGGICEKNTVKLVLVTMSIKQ